MTPFANGGIVNSPTLFPLRGGAGLMGEAGAEAIMPLARGGDGKAGRAHERRPGGERDSEYLNPRCGKLPPIPKPGRQRHHAGRFTRAEEFVKLRSLLSNCDVG